MWDLVAETLVRLVEPHPLPADAAADQAALRAADDDYRGAVEALARAVLERFPEAAAVVRARQRLADLTHKEWGKRWDYTPPTLTPEQCRARLPQEQASPSN